MHDRRRDEWPRIGAASVAETDESMVRADLPRRACGGRGIHHGIDRNTTQRCTLLKRDAELVKSLLQLGVNLRLLLCLAARIGIIRYLLVIYLRQADVAPRRLLQGFPIAESLQAQVKQPPGFFLARGNHAHNVLVESFLDNIIRGYRRRKTVSVLFFGNLFYETIVSRLITHHSNYFS